VIITTNHDAKFKREIARIGINRDLQHRGTGVVKKMSNGPLNAIGGQIANPKSFNEMKMKPLPPKPSGNLH
jgi:hypothetical protein